MGKIKKLLVANRGEIAQRIISTCKHLGIETVSLYTPGEENFSHVLASDVAINLGEGTIGETYLNIEKIINISKKNEVDAIHPGYGFLSENSEFSNAVEKAGILFVGPAADSMELMGDKMASKEAVEKFDVPLIPGYHGNDQNPDLLFEKAKEIGTPLLIKATAGGGGKGMRLVENLDTFKDDLEGAKREAKKAFGNDQVLLEKFITSPRHIEVQVLSDRHGNHLHLFERECSIQRRHQKILEESPSIALNTDLRKDICEAAVRITKGINYLGAGTVEFILDTDGKFYFLEMNTRLQVEHPVTEMVTQKDLVKWQIKIAEGDALPFKQEDLSQKGHAIEARIYAENPDQDFLPSTGKLAMVELPQIPGVRLDMGPHKGSEITINFDPMLAKLLAWGETRDEAIQKLNMALEEVGFLGLQTNREFLGRVLKNGHFQKGETYTHFIETYKDELEKKAPTKKEKALALASYFLKGHTNQSRDFEVEVDKSSPWINLTDFRNI